MDKQSFFIPLPQVLAGLFWLMFYLLILKNIMAFTNNIMIVRHRLLTELVKLWKKNELIERIDRLPIELSPRRSKHEGRCCVHKERAVWRYKSLPLLGMTMEDETDELTPLSEFAFRAMKRAGGGVPKEDILCVIDEACSSCVQINWRNRQTLWGGCTDANPKLLLNDT